MADGAHDSGRSKFAAARGAAPQDEDGTRDQRTLKGEATRARLLEEAMRLFAERGYEGVGTRALAEAAGSNVALITFHFGSKRGLYEAAMENVEQRLRKVVAPAAETLGAGLSMRDANPAALMELVRGLTRDLLTRLLASTPTPGFFQLLAHEMHQQGPLSERLWRLFTPVLHTMEDVLVAASSPELRSKARMASFLHIVAILGLVRDYDVFRRHLNNKNDRTDDAAMLTDLLCAGLIANFPAPPALSPSRSIPC